MITEDYCSFETAKLLKEKGFEGDMNAYYHIWDNGNRVCSMQEFNHSEAPHLYIQAPTHQMAMKWLREVHNIDIIAPPQYDSIKWTYSAIIFKLSIPCTEIRLNDNKDKKEEACEAAIKYCLEHLI